MKAHVCQCPACGEDILFMIPSDNSEFQTACETNLCCMTLVHQLISFLHSQGHLAQPVPNRWKVIE